jgi:hypothetical protein
MTPRPGAAPAAIATNGLALRARPFASTAAATSPPGDQATSRSTTTDEKWGQIRPSRWGQAKSSFSCPPTTSGSGQRPEVALDQVRSDPHARFRARRAVPASITGRIESTASMRRRPVGGTLAFANSSHAIRAIEAPPEW